MYHRILFGALVLGLLGLLAVAASPYLRREVPRGTAPEARPPEVSLEEIQALVAQSEQMAGAAKDIAEWAIDPDNLTTDDRLITFGQPTEKETTVTFVEGGIIIQASSGKKAVLDFRDDLIIHQGELPVEESAVIFFELLFKRYYEQCRGSK